MSHFPRTLNKRELANFSAYTTANPQLVSPPEGAFDAMPVGFRRKGKNIIIGPSRGGRAIHLNALGRGAAFDAAPDEGSKWIELARMLSPEEWARLRQVLIDAEEPDGEDELPENGIEDPRDEDERKRAPAMDAAAVKQYYKNFPHAARLSPGHSQSAQKTNSNVKTAAVAMDSAAAKGYAERFPHADRLK